MSHHNQYRDIGTRANAEPEQMSVEAAHDDAGDIDTGQITRVETHRTCQSESCLIPVEQNTTERRKPPNKQREDIRLDQTPFLQKVI